MSLQSIRFDSQDPVLDGSRAAPAYEVHLPLIMCDGYDSLLELSKLSKTPMATTQDSGRSHLDLTA